MRRLLMVPVLLTALAGTVLFGGCGNSDGDEHASDNTTSSLAPSTVSSSGTASVTPSSSPASTSATPSTHPNLPTCDSVWIDGQTLSFSYSGCLNGDATVRAQKEPCEIGKPLVTYRNKFWASAGGPIHEVATILAKDEGWHRALIQCGG